MKKLLTGLILGLILVGLIFLVSARMMETQVQIHKGWNLIFGFVEPDALSGQLNPDSIKAIYVFIPTTQQYARVYPDPENNKLQSMDDDYIRQTSFWVYSDSETNKELNGVMNADEYKTILTEIESQTKRLIKRATRQADTNARESAKKLLPAVRMMGEYGLRVGSLPSIEQDGDSFIYTTKGSKSFRREITDYFPEGKHPFKNYKTITVQIAFKRVTDRLHKPEKIRHSYTCHDLRHYFAVKFYEETKDLVKLKTLLGHASLNVTDIYLQNIGVLSR